MKLRIAIRNVADRLDVLLVDEDGNQLPCQQHAIIEAPMRRDGAQTITVRFVIDGKKVAFESETTPQDEGS